MKSLFSTTAMSQKHACMNLATANDTKKWAVHIRSVQMERIIRMWNFLKKNHITASTEECV